MPLSASADNDGPLTGDRRGGQFGQDLGECGQGAQRKINPSDQWFLSISYSSIEKSSG